MSWVISAFMRKIWGGILPAWKSKKSVPIYLIIFPEISWMMTPTYWSVIRGGAKGIISASQISTGEENGLNIRVYGTKLGLYWNQENPNYLTVKNKEGYTTTYSKGNKILCPAAQNAARLPPGHPEGIIEALANIYLEAFRAIRDSAANRKKTAYDFPTVNDGVTGMAFVETVLASAASDRKWVKMLPTAKQR